MRYTATLKGEVSARGWQTYEVKIERLEDAPTPFRKFKNCLVVRTVALRVDDSGTQKGYEIVEWLAEGIGAVKIKGELFWKNAQGETIRSFQIDAALENYQSAKATN